MGSAAAHPFDALLGLEATLLQRGYDEGARAGELAGYAQGHALGAARGGAAGEELGFYCGAAEAVLLSRPAATAAGEEDRVRRVAGQVIALASGAELVNPPAARGAEAAGGGGGGGDDDALSDSEAPPGGGSGPVDVFATLQLVRAKFRLLTMLAKLPGLCYDPAARRGQQENTF